MHPSPSSARRAALGLALASAALPACTRTATQVLVQLDTDATPARRLQVRVRVRADGDAGESERLLERTAAAGTTLDGAVGAAFPASFGVTPAAGAARRAPVTLVLESALDAAGPSAPALAWRQTARFTLIENVASTLRVFLAVRCGASAAGCTSVAREACTASVWCEERGLTCTTGGACGPVDVDLAHTTPADAAPAADGFTPAGECTVPPAAPTIPVLDFDAPALPTASDAPVAITPATLANAMRVAPGADSSAGALRFRDSVSFAGGSTTPYLTRDAAVVPEAANAVALQVRVPAGSPLLDAAMAHLDVRSHHARPGALTTPDAAMENHAEVALPASAADQWVRLVLAPSAFAVAYGYYHFDAAAAGTDALPFVPSIRALELFLQAPPGATMDVDDITLVTLPAVATVCPPAVERTLPARDGDVLEAVTLANPTDTPRTYRAYVSSHIGIERATLAAIYAAGDQVSIDVAQTQAGSDGGRMAAELFAADAAGNPTGASVTLASDGIAVPAHGAWRGVVVHHVRAAMLGAPMQQTFGTTPIAFRRDTLTTSVIVWDPATASPSTPGVARLASNADQARAGGAPGFPTGTPEARAGWTSRDVPIDQATGTFVSRIHLAAP